ncbi:MAG: replication factor C large subunit [Halobacteriales archaeon]
MADWTEKYRPTTLSAVRGNDKAVEALREWAETWPEHREAVVLHGRPGVGKTSAAHALANDLGWSVVELNASDQRTADVVERVAGEAADGGTLSGGAGGRKLVLLDEADNLHGNADRGGARAITGLVKDAEQPVVLVANEYYEMSRGLRNACRDIEFRDVSARSILPVLRDVCRREDVTAEDGALEAVAEQNSGDLRGAINDLQALADAGGHLAVDDVVTAERDTTEDVFPFLESLFQDASPEAARRASFDVDETPDDLIGWIEDNLPKEYDGAELAGAYRFLADADKWLGRVRATQDYRYWRYAADAMTAGVAAARDGEKGGWTRYGPPSYWRKLGASRAARDRRDHVARAIAESSGVSLATARRSVLPFLAAMTHHCTNRELTLAMTAAFELDAEHVAFVTGSGEDTNKVQSIVADARELREAEAVDHSAGAFEGTTADDRGLGAFGPSDDADADGDRAGTDGNGADAADEDERAADPDEADADDSQSGLADFT